jgi:hypothetical protein
MLEGIRKINGDITREKLYEKLKDRNFSAKGGNNLEVKFDSKSDRIIDASNKDKLMFLVTPLKIGEMEKLSLKK